MLRMERAVIRANGLPALLSEEKILRKSSSCSLFDTGKETMSDGDVIITTRRLIFLPPPGHPQHNNAFTLALELVERLDTQSPILGGVKVRFILEQQGTAATTMTVAVSFPSRSERNAFFSAAGDAMHTPHTQTAQLLATAFALENGMPPPILRNVAPSHDGLAPQSTGLWWFVERFFACFANGASYVCEWWESMLREFRARWRRLQTTAGGSGGHTSRSSGSSMQINIPALLADAEKAQLAEAADREAHARKAKAAKAAAKALRAEAHRAAREAAAREAAARAAAEAARVAAAAREAAAAEAVREAEEAAFAAEAARAAKAEEAARVAEAARDAVVAAAVRAAEEAAHASAAARAAKAEEAAAAREAEAAAAVRAAEEAAHASAAARAARAEEAAREAEAAEAARAAEEAARAAAAAREAEAAEAARAAEEAAGAAAAADAARIFAAQLLEEGQGGAVVAVEGQDNNPADDPPSGGSSPDFAVLTPGPTPPAESPVRARTPEEQVLLPLLRPVMLPPLPPPRVGNGVWAHVAPPGGPPAHAVDSEGGADAADNGEGDVEEDGFVLVLADH